MPNAAKSSQPAPYRHDIPQTILPWQAQKKGGRSPPLDLQPNFKLEQLLIFRASHRSSLTGLIRTARAPQAMGLN